MANGKSNTAKEVATVPFDKSKIKKLKSVTLPLLKQEDEKEYYVKITSKFYKGKDINGNTTADTTDTGKADSVKKKEPPYLCRIVNLETGEEMELIANSVMKSNLEEIYPDSGYVGKCFEVVRYNIQGKQYKGYHITEISWDE
jgi:hypothetical protein